MRDASESSAPSARSASPEGAPQQQLSRPVAAAGASPHTRRDHKRKKAAIARGLEENSGGVLLSHHVTLAVPAALRGLTSEFGMGSGGTLSTSPPKT